MIEPTIFIDMEHVPLEKAHKTMTNEWVDEGNYCAQTVIDMRDALKKCLKENKSLNDAIKTDYWPNA
jgi:hypothetical protein